MDNESVEFPRIDDLTQWIKLREEARTNPEGCGDYRIDDYRYCNVKREDDRVTKWIAENWRKRENTIPALCMARLFNQPRTLLRLGYPYDWDPELMMRRLEQMQASGLRIFNAAYIVSTNGKRMDKCEYVIWHVLDPIFKDRLRLEYAELEDCWRKLTTFTGMGSFIGAQVIADYKNCNWVNAPDHWTFVAPGPGSMRGLNRLRGLEAAAQKYNQKSFSMYLQPLRGIIKARTGLDLCAQDAQNCLCEFDKFMRLTLGEGRPKQKYSREGK